MDRPTFATKTYGCVLGVDVGKLSHWACAVAPDGEELPSGPVANTEPGIDALLAGLPARALVVVDQRGNIGALVTGRARAAGMDVAYLPGIAGHKVAEALPGIAKTDSVDAGIIATTALGMPRMLRPVPEEDPALDAVRVMAAERASLVRDRTARADAPGARLPGSCPAFEAACDFSRPWLAASLAEAGGPWDVLASGRRSWSARVRRRGGTAEEPRGSFDAVSGTPGRARPSWRPRGPACGASPRGSRRTPGSSPSSTRRSRGRSPTTGATATCPRSPASARRPRPSS